MNKQSIKKGRVESFSDGVIAIIITIMALELKTPQGTAFTDLLPTVPVLLSYVLSFVYIAIYWNNHHHLFRLAPGVNGAIMWANMHLLFWLSLIPFVTSWIGKTHDAVAPVVSYGVVLLMNAFAYRLLAAMLARHAGEHSPLAQAVGRGLKGKLSLLLYGVGVGTSFFWPDVGLGIYIAVALIWLVPDRRVEEVMEDDGTAQEQ